MTSELDEMNQYLKELREEATYLQQMVDRGILKYPTEHSMWVLEKEIERVEYLKNEKFRYAFKNRNSQTQTTKTTCITTPPNGEQFINTSVRQNVTNNNGAGDGNTDTLSLDTDTFASVLSLKESAAEFIPEVSVTTGPFNAEKSAVTDATFKNNGYSNMGTLNIYRNIIANEKITIETQIYFPVKQFPWVNFSGPFIGPNGRNIKKLQELTRTKIAVLGKLSKSENDVENERSKIGGNYQNSEDRLHVWVQSTGIAANAYLKMGLAISEITIRIKTLIQAGGKKWPSFKDLEENVGEYGGKFIKKSQ